MAKLITYTFAVQGAMPFPIDMLRHDRCYPRTESDATAAMGERGEQRKVVLVHVTEDRYWLPTYGRWESFGWPCVAIDDTSDLKVRASK